ncbi:hypothetical protein [Cronobacter turicensis]|uniref:hypothetical protein n=1 Tax=Cronobacter turicensis TaxID=413502 RepID=UPI000CFA8863|nr:hypothetical protein [Cronobacter turicensis]
MEKFYTSQEKAKAHDTTIPLLKAMYSEFKEISKKKPDSAIGKGKIKIVNRLLEKVKTVLVDEESIIFLDLLDEDDVPQASDVTLILSQYVAAMDAFRERHHGWDGSKHGWFIG